MAGPAAAQDMTAPTAGTATLARATITIPFDEQLNSSEPPTSAFAVTIATVSAPVGDVDIIDETVSGVTKSKVRLDLGIQPGPNEAVTVAYTVPTTNPLRDTSGNQVLAFSKTGLETTDSSWSTIAVDSATAQTSSSVKIVFDGNMSATTGNTHSRFTVSAGGQDRTPTNMNFGFPKTVWLTGLSPALVKGDTITVSYTNAYTASLANANRLASSDFKLLNSFSAQAVTNEVAEAVQSAVVDGDTLTLTYTGALGTTQVPSGQN